MPTVKTKPSIKPRKDSETAAAVTQHPALMDACDLIGTMLDYEAIARKKGIDLASGRFSMLTASERQFLHAELVADYIRLSAGNMGNTPGYFDSALKDFCSTVCDMEITSHELIGTYLAAVDVVTKGEHLSQVSGLIEAVRGTMITALQGCVELMKVKIEEASVSSTSGS